MDKSKEIVNQTASVENQPVTVFERIGIVIDAICGSLTANLAVLSLLGVTPWWAFLIGIGLYVFWIILVFAFAGLITLSSVLGKGN